MQIKEGAYEVIWRRFVCLIAILYWKISGILEDHYFKNNFPMNRQQQIHQLILIFQTKIK